MARGRRRWTPLAAVVGVLAAAAMIVLPDEAGADTARCAGYSAAHERAARAVTGRGEPVVVIGDSYAVGFGLLAAEAWPARLDARPHVDGYPGSGFSPDASPCGDVSFADRAASALGSAGDAGTVVVQGGLNDFDQPDAAIEAGFTRLIQVIGDRRVLVVGPPSAPARADAVPRVDRLLARLAGEHGVPYLRMSGHDLPYLRDRLHLTPEGHEMFGDAVAEHLAPM